MKIGPEHVGKMVCCHGWVDQSVTVLYVSKHFFVADVGDGSEFSYFRDAAWELFIDPPVKKLPSERIAELTMGERYSFSATSNLSDIDWLKRKMSAIEKFLDQHKEVFGE